MGVIARQSIKGALANYLGVAIGFFVQFFVVTRYLTTEEVGLTRVMVDAAMLFSSLAQLGTNASIIRFFPYFKDQKNNHGIFGWSILLPLAGFALFALIFLIFKEQILSVYSENAPLLANYFYLLPMLTFFALYMTVFETNASVLLRITVPKLVREVGIRVFNLTAYLLYGFDLISLDTFVYIFCGSYGLAMVLNLMYLLSLGHISFRIEPGFLNRKKVKEIIRYTLFMTATVLAGNIPLFNSLFLGAKAGLAMTGVFTIASYIANVVEVPYRSLGAISRPVIATAVKDDNWSEVNRLSRQVSLHQLLVSVLIFYVIWINIDALFAVIPNGDKYADGKWVVFVLGMAKVINSSFSVGTDVLNYSRHYSRSLIFITLLTASAILLNNWMIDAMDGKSETGAIIGASCATLCAYILYFTVLYTYLWRKLRVSVFSYGQVKIVVLAVVLLVADWAWNQWVTSAWGMNVIFGAIVKTLVLGGGAAAAVYLWQVSPTVHTMVQTSVHNLIKKLRHTQ